jgi:acyl carrier protein
MKSWLRSFFGPGSSRAQESGPRASNTLETAPTRDSPEAAPSTPSGVLQDLRRCICANAEPPLEEEGIDTRLHMYDAGYVTSVTAADLLVYIEDRYGIEISEVDLVGRLDSLDALVAHITAQIAGD